MTELPDILGHERNLARLREAVEADRLHHAYLFEGPSGVGKRLVGRWLAVLANCTAEDHRPCGQCNACRTILAGNHPDVTELTPDEDRASGTISPAQVREVIRATGYHRYAARRRFILIDPAEAMATAAANALLKTLEEPPAGTGFVLICTHADRLLPTIVSRCQRMRFGPIPRERLATWLAARGVDEPDAVATLADGCPGRAVSLADGALAERRAARAALLDALGGDLGGLFAYSESLTKGGRAQWTPRVEAVLELVEELLRDAVVRAQGPERALLHADIPHVIDAWTAALWPGGIVACQRALQATRDDLALFVTGKTTLDALFTTLATELGKARAAGVTAP